MSYSIADIDTYESLPDHTRRAVEALAKGGYLPTSEDCWCHESSITETDAEDNARCAMRDANALEYNANAIANALDALLGAQLVSAHSRQYDTLRNAVDALLADARMALPR